MPLSLMPMARGKQRPYEQSPGASPHEALLTLYDRICNLWAT
jgi:hypothetical protein